MTSSMSAVARRPSSTPPAMSLARSSSSTSPTTIGRASEWCWSNLPANEAYLRGAKAIILTTSTVPLDFYADPNSLGSNDGEYDLAWPSMVYIDRTDGDWLKAQCAQGPVTATVKLDSPITLASQGGVGYNVIGAAARQRQERREDHRRGHHDAFFQGAIDNTSAVVAELTMAKAMRMSGYMPRRTLVFYSSTGEEGGIIDSWYDWDFGAWYAATKTHTGWPGTVAGFLNMEGVGSPNGLMGLGASPELARMTSRVVAANPELIGPGGPRASARPSTAAATSSHSRRPASPAWRWVARPTPGTPGTTTTRTTTRPASTGSTSRAARSWSSAWRELWTCPWCPTTSRARANQLKATVNAGDLGAAGAQPVAVQRLVRAVTAFRSAALATRSVRSTSRARTTRHQSPVDGRGQGDQSSLHGSLLVG